MWPSSSNKRLIVARTAASSSTSSKRSGFDCPLNVSDGRARGARLDTTGKEGTGLGLAIVRDVAEIYGGSVALGESEDLGGLLATLTLPAG